MEFSIQKSVVYAWLSTYKITKVRMKVAVNRMKSLAKAAWKLSNPACHRLIIIVRKKKGMRMKATATKRKPAGSPA